MRDRIKGSFLPWLSVSRPVTVLMVLLCTLVLGLIAYARIGVQILPSGLDFRYLSISARPESQASPVEVEKQITRPLEEMLRTVPGIERVWSRSRAFDTYIQLSFDQRTNMKLAFSQVRDRIERTMPDLPQTVRRVQINKYNQETDIPILYFVFNTPATLEDPYHFAETQIKRRLERIDGVANVDFWGPQEKRIYIDLDRQKMQSLGVDLYQLYARLNSDNFALSSGWIEDGGSRLMVRSVARFTTLEEIERLPLGVRGLTLGEVARVRYIPLTEKAVLRQDGQPCTEMGVWKESMANTVKVSQEVERVLKEDIPAQPGLGWLDFKVFFNAGDYILEAIGNIKQTCLWGGIFAVLILLFFLRSWRMTTIITLAIPLSLLMTVTVMYFLGWTLDLVTMMGLMISIGMVVDNSIVVVENIFRLRQEGLDSTRAAIGGASEVSLAITLSTLTTIVVFLPMMLFGNDRQFSFYMVRIGIPVIVALAGSLLVALYFIPLGTVRISRKKVVSERKIISRCNDYYQRILTWCLGHRLDTALLLIALMASSLIPLKKIKMMDYSNLERDRTSISLDLPNYVSWEKSQAIFNQVEAFLNARRQRYGIESLSLRHWLTWGQFELFRPIKKYPWYELAYRDLRKKMGIPVDKTLAYEDLVRELNDSLPRFPDVVTQVNWSSDVKEDPSMNLIIYGDDPGTLLNIAKEVRRRLSAIEGLTGVNIDMETGTDELRVKVDRLLAHQYGLSARYIGSTVGYAGSQARLTDFRSSDKEIGMYMRFSDADSMSREKLANQPVFTSSGRSVPLGTLAEFSVSKGDNDIVRENGKNFKRIRAFANKDNTGEIFARVDAMMAGIEMPQGYSWDKGSSIRQREQQQESQWYGVVAGVIFVFLIMGLLFESFVLPLCVIISVPFSFCGSYWALYLTGTSLEIMSMIGLIIMVGVVVNNAIVLVDTIRMYRDRGMERTQAILEAGRHRFRPILMTAATTIGGLIPMAVGGAKMIDLSYAPMGRTMIGGMVTSTLVTLVAVPLLYTFFDDLRGFGSRLAGRFLGRDGEETTGG